LRGRRACGKCDQTGGQQYDFAAHQVLPTRSSSGEPPLLSV
jgi:hypothetical protein